MMLATYTSNDEGRVFVAVETVAKAMGIAERHAREHIQALVGEDLLRPVSNEHSGRGPVHYLLPSEVVGFRVDERDKTVTPDDSGNSVTPHGNVRRPLTETSATPHGNVTRRRIRGSQSESGATPTARARDSIWEALVAAWEHDPDTLTPSERGRVNKAAKELRDMNVSAEDITVRAAVFCQKYPDAGPPSPQALTGNWSALDQQRVPRLVHPPRWFATPDDADARSIDSEPRGVMPMPTRLRPSNVG